ncbi:hypothetical protein GGX14DRAFT_448797, partial [Mycena pura]
MDVDQLETSSLILLFTTYYFVERILRSLLASYASPFFTSLRNTRKDAVFFGIAMGLLISLISTPSCSRLGATWRIWSSPSTRTDWLMDFDTKMCFGARAVLWVSELNRLDLYPVYVVHHTGAISSLLVVVYFRYPFLPYLVILSTLISEVPGDIMWMLSAYIDSLESHPPRLVRLKTDFNKLNVAQYTFIRGAGAVLAAWFLWSRPEYNTAPLPVQMLAWLFLTLYALFCASYVARQVSSIRAHLQSDRNSQRTSA